MSPNIYLTRNRWKSETCLSDINPQMKDYLWGTAELTHWTAYDGTQLDGLVYKPENFDPTKKYPVLLYFYERCSDRLYSYYAPAPSRSTINIPFYCSRGYIVFVPDVVYHAGTPGESAYNCIVSGVEALARNPWVDRENIAIQGQSWGGYEVAYLITRTNLFKAAEAGAAVVNMVSAYGGIRWETGMSRQFQYEHTQSRIGRSLWEAPELYIANSPVFKLDRVQTPVLIMHNDADGAVPWYQGIEFFTGLRRLGKKAWMLEYNGEAHNLRERRNCKDLSIRLQQFFDHYLKGAPLPAWMKSGIPATRKGEYFGFELEKE
jgi:dipeptidyl aminopeptidase/acylaminoacyl peptidase